mmetsp:Transcript_9155/g.10053  ORF Transcript_9155/g.10053 Transcript_9155/m.10053 type:complete len:470 (+) Transcript_9155:241-1650(+)
MDGLASCGTGCGLIAAFIGVIGFGSFGAPLKGQAANSVNPDPFVLQTYKSTMCFLTSFLVLFLGEEYKFSPLGIVSGLLWVSGGICGIFGIRNSGLAISVGTWSAITVLVSFTWGIFIFGEQVKSMTSTLTGIVLMIGGFIGMTYFSSPDVVAALDTHTHTGVANDNANTSYTDSNMVDVHVDVDSDEDKDNDTDVRSREKKKKKKDQENGLENKNKSNATTVASVSNTSSTVMSSSLELDQNSNDESLKEPLLDQFDKMIMNHHNDNDEERQGEGTISPVSFDNDDNNANNDVDIDDENQVIFLGMKWNRRRLGILGAAMDGVLGGGNLIPMHYSSYHGLEYIISFATGAMIVTISFWCLRLGVNAHEQKSLKKGWMALPSMHLRTLFVPGVLSGTLWSIGNIGQIMSVTFLGESIGMSIVQSSMIISGVLGIMWYREVKGFKAILYWSLSAFVTFLGIIFLSREHKS